MAQCSTPQADPGSSESHSWPLHLSRLNSGSLSLAAPLAAETTVKTIEDAFKEYTNREDIAIVMISQYVSPEWPCGRCVRLTLPCC